MLGAVGEKDIRVGMAQRGRDEKKSEEAHELGEVVYRKGCGM